MTAIVMRYSGANRLVTSLFLMLFRLKTMGARQLLEVSVGGKRSQRRLKTGKPTHRSGGKESHQSTQANRAYVEPAAKTKNSKPKKQPEPTLRAARTDD